LRQYDFPGNVRELQNLMERAVLLANGRAVEPCHFLLETDTWPLFEEDSVESAPLPADNSGDVLPASVPAPAPAAAGAVSGGQGAFDGAVIPLHEMERIMIIKGLEVTSGNRTQAAELLGISVRTLRNKLNEYKAMGLPVE
ncbi:MAG: helix-turn-helix domain-containing protein, partial [Desulfovibrionaceae bacterium]|nr:helix-turn-helix domain-containing protein [Desulfovibrionaceae bacterium]